VTFLQENVPLAPFTTFRIGGPARYFVDAASEADVLAALDFAKTHEAPLFVLGGGSNLLVSDAGFPGLVVRINLKGTEWEPAEDRVLLRAAAGEDWDPVVAACVDRGLGGVECLSGIPGSVGGTPVQNVGAYGQEISDVLVAVRALDRRTGAIVELAREQCGFSYRASIFNTTDKDRYIVLQVTYALPRNQAPCLTYPDVKKRFAGRDRTPALADVRRAVREIRAAKSMLLVDGDPDSRSAGSFFKNPIVTEDEYARIQNASSEPVPRYPAPNGGVKLAAAWLIERAGFHKGFSMGPAAVSRNHTLALVNRGGASAGDIVRLARTIRFGVEDRFGIRLAPEPVFVGFDGEF